MLVVRAVVLVMVSEECEKQTAVEPVAVPNGWSKQTDPSSSKMYYWNKKTRESS
jgi:hypothetical protein